MRNEVVTAVKSRHGTAMMRNLGAMKSNEPACYKQEVGEGAMSKIKAGESLIKEEPIEKGEEDSLIDMETAVLRLGEESAILKAEGKFVPALTNRVDVELIEK